MIKLFLNAGIIGKSLITNFRLKNEFAKNRSASDALR